MRFFTTAVSTYQNGLRRATRPIAPTDIRRTDDKTKGLNRTDLISLDQARTRPTLVYGGFVDRKTDLIISDDSPLDNLARWASQQCKFAPTTASGISPLRAAADGMAPFTAFMDEEDDVDFYRGFNGSDDSLDSAGPSTPVPAAPVFLPGTITATLIPLDKARSRDDIRYRPEAFEMRRNVF